MAGFETRYPPLPTWEWDWESNLHDDGVERQQQVDKSSIDSTQNDLGLQLPDDEAQRELKAPQGVQAYPPSPARSHTSTYSSTPNDPKRGPDHTYPPPTNLTSARRPTLTLTTPPTPSTPTTNFTHATVPPNPAQASPYTSWVRSGPSTPTDRRHTVTGPLLTPRHTPADLWSPQPRPPPPSPETPLRHPAQTKPVAPLFGPSWPPPTSDAACLPAHAPTIPPSAAHLPTYALPPPSPTLAARDVHALVAGFEALDLAHTCGACGNDSVVPINVPVLVPSPGSELYRRASLGTLQIPSPTSSLLAPPSSPLSPHSSPSLTPAHSRRASISSVTSPILPSPADPPRPQPQTFGSGPTFASGPTFIPFPFMSPFGSPMPPMPMSAPSASPAPSSHMDPLPPSSPVPSSPALAPSPVEPDTPALSPIPLPRIMPTLPPPQLPSRTQKTPPQGQGTWTCPACTLTNTTPRCVACDAPAPEWACGECTLLNEHAVRECVACGAKRPAPSPRAVTGQTSNSAEGPPGNARATPNKGRTGGELIDGVGVGYGRAEGTSHADPGGGHQKIVRKGFMHGGWMCATCTYGNAASEARCAMCDAARPT